MSSYPEDLVRSVLSKGNFELKRKEQEEKIVQAVLDVLISHRLTAKDGSRILDLTSQKIWECAVIPSCSEESEQSLLGDKNNKSAQANKFITENCTPDGSRIL